MEMTTTVYQEGLCGVCTGQGQGQRESIACLLECAHNRALLLGSADSGCCASHTRADRGVAYFIPVFHGNHVGRCGVRESTVYVGCFELVKGPY
jgi:hypothetical protein